MNNPQNVTIALLAVLALVLGAMLIGAYTTDANAGATAIQGTEFIATPMAFSNTRDVVIVIDRLTHRIGAYALNNQNGTVELIGEPVDLEKAFE